MKNFSFDRIGCLLWRSKNNLFQQFTYAGSLFLTLLCFAVAASAQADFASFINRSDFNTVSSNLSTIDFESVAPAKGGFGKFPVNEGLTVNRAGFRTSGGGKFGAGMILVLSENYAAANPMYNTGTGAVLAWGPPNQQGDGYLDVTLPGGVYAVGADLWTGQPYVSTVDVIATTSEGKTQSVTVNTQQRPASAFAGFVSDKEITSIRFQIPKGQSWLFLDNFTYGRKREGANLNSTVSVTVTRGEEKQNTNQAETPVIRSESSPEKPSPKSVAVRSNEPREQTNNQSSTNNKNGVPIASAGTIAYMRGGKEIRLIAPDGTNDRRIWTHARATETIGINQLAWRPDGKELAFSSGHDAIVSLFHADIYAVKPDGTGLRKLTNAPDHGDLARFPKGSVTVTVRNSQPIYRQSNASAGVFIIYVAGADEPQQTTLPPGASQTLVFKSVADFGDHAQPIVALMGRNRWFIPGTDVKAGRMTKAPDFAISGDGITLFGAFRPVWRNDGSRLSYRTGLCTVSSIPVASSAIGYNSSPLFGENSVSGTCAWDWGPTPALANQIIYQAGSSTDWSIYRGTEGGKHPGEKLFGWGEDELEFLEDLRWLPDGSGFIFSSSPSIFDFPAGNISLVNLATKQRILLTNFKEHLIGQMSVSRDGHWIAFERAASRDAKTADIWIVGTDGKNLRLLVKDGWNPAWSR
jgi:TolB protein